MSLLHLSENKTIFIFGTCLGALETHNFITFLWSFFYESPVINVTLLTLKKKYTQYKANVDL